MTTPINWDPDRKTLADFSEIGLFLLGLVALPLALLRGRLALAGVIWVLAVGLRLLGLIRPHWLKPIFVGLLVVTWPIGWVVSHVVMALIYLLVITPIALIFRLRGRDALQRRFDPEAASYWEPYQPDRGLDRYLRQY